MTLLEQVANSSGWADQAQRDRDESNDSIREPTSGTVGDAASFLVNTHRSILLSRVVNGEILPRLAMARSAVSSNKPDLLTSEDDTAELVRLLMGKEESGAWTFIQSLELRGATPASLYLGILTQAARRLGELWEDDRCSFAQVTISLGRLQQVVRALSPAFQTAAVRRSAHSDTVLLLPAPGEQHTFGLVILAEFFQREGWHLTGGPVSTGYDAAELVRSHWVDVVGFSIGSMSRLDGLTTCIHAVRKASKNRYLGVMVGGPLFLQHPELVARVGADTTAADAPSAVRQARTLLAIRAAAD